MSTKRVLYKRDTLHVGNWRDNILAWLNEDLPKGYYSAPARRRIEQLIEALRTLIRLRSSFKTISAGPSRGGFSPVTIKMPREAHNSIMIVQRLMRRYPSWPTLGWDREGNLSFGRLSDRLRRSEEEEAEAAIAVMSLAEVNELRRLRRCLCGKWFFARREAQKSCSANCRHRLYEQTEKFRARRRRYMKQYYKLQHSGKVK